MTQNKPKEVRQDEILDAAQKCFMDEGQHRTTIDDIARVSGLTKGGIYWHFKDKREIFIAVIERHLEEDMLMWEGLIEGKRLDFALITDAGISYLRHMIQDRRHLYLHAKFFAESFRDDLLRAKLNQIHCRWRNKIRETLRCILEGSGVKHASTKAQRVSCALMATIEGLAHQYWLSGDIEEMSLYEEAWKDLTAHLSKGIGEERLA